MHVPNDDGLVIYLQGTLDFHLPSSPADLTSTLS